MIGMVVRVVEDAREATCAVAMGTKEPAFPRVEMPVRKRTSKPLVLS
jgi:hypothetical protein